MKTPFQRHGLALVAATVVSLEGISQAAIHDVDIVGFAFSPQNVTITTGETVRWTERDDLAFHTTTSDGGLWDSGGLALNATFSFVFNASGNYPYHCEPHPFMTGSVLVQPPPNTPPSITITNPVAKGRSKPAVAAIRAKAASTVPGLGSGRPSFFGRRRSQADTGVFGLAGSRFASRKGGLHSCS